MKGKRLYNNKNEQISAFSSKFLGNCVSLENYCNGWSKGTVVLLQNKHYIPSQLISVFFSTNDNFWPQKLRKTYNSRVVNVLVGGKLYVYIGNLKNVSLSSYYVILLKWIWQNKCKFGDDIQVFQFKSQPCEIKELDKNYGSTTNLRYSIFWKLKSPAGLDFSWGW